MTQAAGAREHVAVVLIHGIGDLRAGNVSAAAVEGVRAVLPDITLRAVEGGDAEVPGQGGGPSTGTRTTRLEWRSAFIDVVEFHWAGIPGKMRLRHPLRAIRQVMGVVREFPSMAVGTGSSTGFRHLARSVGVLLAGLFLTWMIALGGSVGELALKTGPWVHSTGDENVLEGVTAELFTPGSAWFLENRYYWSYAATWAVLPVVILAVSLAMIFGLVFLVSMALPSLRPLGVLVRTSAAAAVVALLVCMVPMLAHSAASVYVGVAAGSGAGITTLLVIAAVFLAVVLTAFALALRPANLLRDIVHYLGSDAAGARLADQQRIHAELGRLIAGLCGQPAITRLVLVCHSLGTVIVADLLLTGRPALGSGRALPVDLVTAGSPIRRLINALLPHRLPPPLEIRRRLAEGGLPVARWFNAYRVLDFIGTRLVPLRSDARDPAVGIRECPLGPRWRWPWGHANYWADRRFIRLLAAEVLAPVLAPADPGLDANR